MLDTIKILTKPELQAVLSENQRLGKRSANTRRNGIIFRLAACCGMRVGEISKVTLGDFQLDSNRPYIQIRSSIAKRRHARRIPLWWDGGTLNALRAWKAERIANGANDSSPFVCHKSGKPLSVRNIQYRFKTAIRVLGGERQEFLSIHCGRHSFCSHALAGGRTLPEVRDAAGHKDISVTSIYLHSLDNGETIGNLFAA